MSGERGFALIAALWLLVMISLVGLELSLSARDQRLAAANTLERTQAQAAAEAGLQHVRARLARALQRTDEIGPGAASGIIDPWERPRRLFPDTVRMGDAGYRVGLYDAGSRLHLNRADEAELRRFFAALRVDYGEADRIAQSIMDWRDPDRAHRGRGAERDYYIEVGSPVLPRDGAFQELGELRHVRGVTPEIYERARPYLTLLGTGRINLNAADPPVLAALPGLGDEAVAVLLRHRRQGDRISSLQRLAEELSPPAREALLAETPALLARTSFETREVVALSEGWIDGGRVRVEIEGLLVRASSTAFLVWRRVL